MSELKEVDGRKVGRYLLNSDCSGRIDAEELANACRRLGISGPLEPLLRELKIKDENSVTSATPTAAAAAAKDSPRKTSQKREKRLSCSKTRESPDYSLEQFDIKGGNSYSKESWGRDSGARDLSPEPNSHRLHELNVESQLMDTEAGGTSAMLHLASKVSTLPIHTFFLVLFLMPAPSNSNRIWLFSTTSHVNYGTLYRIIIDNMENY